MQYPAVPRLLIAFSSVLLGCVDLDAEPTEATVAAALIPACPTGTWCIEAPPLTTTPRLHGISAVNAGDVFAVGDDGTILRRTGGAWLAMTSGTMEDLRGVWARTSSDVWAVGTNGTILHFNGAAWSSVTGVTTVGLEAVWGSSASDVWIVGSSLVLRWNGSTYSSTALTGSLLSVSGTSASDVWVAGENANVRHYASGAWTTVSPGVGTSTFFAVLALGANDVWVTDYMPNKEAVHLTGGKWVPTKTTNGIFNGLSLRTTNDLWGAGGNRIGRWNGTAWTTAQPLGSNVVLWSVATTANDVWVVGDSAMIAHQAL